MKDMDNGNNERSYRGIRLSATCAVANSYYYTFVWK
jgi:hypothetical protein